MARDSILDFMDFLITQPSKKNWVESCWNVLQIDCISYYIGEMIFRNNKRFCYVRLIYWTLYRFLLVDSKTSLLRLIGIVPTNNNHQATLSVRLDLGRVEYKVSYWVFYSVICCRGTWLPYQLLISGFNHPSLLQTANRAVKTDALDACGTWSVQGSYFNGWNTDFRNLE